MFRSTIVTLEILALTLCLIVASGSAAEHLDQSWQVNMTFTAGVTTYEPTFGVHPDGTDGFNANIDIPIPMEPPGNVPFAYFPLNDPIYDKLMMDIRGLINSDNPERTWLLKIRSSTDVMTLSWKTANFPSYIDCTLTTVGGVEYDMKTTTSIASITAGSGYQEVTIVAKYSDAPERFTVASVSPINNITIAYGTAFADLGLPTTVVAILNDDSERTVAVNWSDVGYNSTSADTYTLEGTLVNLPADVTNPKDVKATVNVIVDIERFTVEDVAPINNITVAYGTAFADLGLPTTVFVILNDDSERTVAVNWAAGGYDPDTAGTYTLKGTLVNLPADVTNPKDVKATVNVIVDTSDDSWKVNMTFIAGVTTYEPTFGVHPDGTDGFNANIDIPIPMEPPGNVPFAYFPLNDPIYDKLMMDIRGLINADNPERTWLLKILSSTDVMTLSWKTSNFPSYIDCTLTVGGVEYDMKTTTSTVPITAGSGYQEVTIVAEYSDAPERFTVASVAPINNIIVAYGTAFADLGLPTTVVAILNDDSERTVAVNWAAGGYDSDTTGTYTLKGTLVNLPADVTNPKDVKATVNVIVDIERFTVEDVAPINNITVAYGTAFADLGLPTTVVAILNDDSERTVAVTWAAGGYDPDTAGTYTLEGTLVNLPADVTNPEGVKATVNVIVDIERFTVTFNVTEALVPHEGEPIAGAEVLFNGETKLTGEQGHVVFTDVPAGIYDWSVEKLMYLKETGEQPVHEDTRIDVALSRHVEVYNVYFTVIDADEEPVQGALVRIAGELLEQEGYTDADGFIVFSGIPPGEYGYRISAHGFLPDVGTFDIVDGMREINITLETGLPATIMAGNPVIPTGMNRTTGVSVANMQNMTSVGVNLTFNTDLAEVTHMQVNASVTDHLKQFAYTIDNTTGHVRVAMVLSHGLDTGAVPIQILDLTIAAKQMIGSDPVKIVFSEYTIGDDFADPYLFDIEEDGLIRVRQRGDFNDNNRIDIGDVARVAYMAVGLFPDDPEARFSGGVKVTEGDAAKIAYFYVGAIHEL